MSSNTWTRDELASSTIALKGRCWRVVEAQSKISTTKITDTLEEQDSLERLIEETKSKVPEECKHLGYLLFTPFRYIPYPFESRFRRAGSRDGVFYAADECDTAIAEKAFYRLLFYWESPDTPWPVNPGEYTAFASDYAVARAVDLTGPPFVSRRALWTHPVDYADCLNFADTAREMAIDAIRYESVRDPGSRANVALLTCRAFTAHDLVDRRTWHLHFSSNGVRAFCEFPSISISFDRKVFASDPRITTMRWDR
jgi:hypothetical protein